MVNLARNGAEDGEVCSLTSKSTANTTDVTAATGTERSTAIRSRGSHCAATSFLQRLTVTMRLSETASVRDGVLPARFIAHFEGTLPPRLD